MTGFYAGISSLILCALFLVFVGFCEIWKMFRKKKRADIFYPDEISDLKPIR